MGEVKVMSNIYSKMQKARCEFQEKPLKKSGHNKFAGYHYFELGDFLPTINALLEKHNLCSHMDFGKEVATLTIINSENPEEKLEFKSPMSEASLKGCHAVQNLGAVQTYLRRYLWVNAFEIVESDGLDATSGKVDVKEPGKTKANVNAHKIEKLMTTKDVDPQAVMQFVRSTYKVDSFDKLNDTQVKKLIEMLNQQANKNA
ncbi:MAG: ERF family protein [Turicibacter sp.]|nr:ERF family protein [Turicibacter sp.]